MFNNYAIVQGVDHIVPVDMYLPGCPPRPEMLIDAILKLHDKIMHEPLGAERAARCWRPARSAATADRAARRDAVVATASTRPGAPSGPRRSREGREEQLRIENWMKRARTCSPAGAK